MTFTIYKETVHSGDLDWGSRRTEEEAREYGKDIVSYYLEGDGRSFNETDPLLHVRAVEDRTGRRVFNWDSPEVR